MPTPPISERLNEMEVGLNAPVTVPMIGTLLGPFGYDAAKMDEGRALLAEARDLVSQQQVEYGEQYAATRAVQAAWDAAMQAYQPTLALARVALKNDTAAQTARGPR